MKKKVLIFVLSLFVHFVDAQKVEVTRFALEAIHTEIPEGWKMDLNDEPCALVKIQMEDGINKVEGNIIGSPQKMNGETWIYVTEGSKEIKIQPAHSVSFMVSFSDFGIKSLRGKCSYILEAFATNSLGVSTQKLIVDYKPVNATVTIDGKQYDGKSHLEIRLPFGTYDYVIESAGYIKQSGTIKLDPESAGYINVNLKEIGRSEDDSENLLSASELNDLGAKAKKEGNYKKAVEYLRKSADKGYVLAMFNLGMCYAQGVGLNPSILEAWSWYKKAADKGYAPAMNSLGAICEKKHAVAEAMTWYRKAADRGLLVAQFNLGTILMNQQKYEDAISFLQKAAEQGFAAAQCNLGLLYERGLGTVQNYSKAFEWYQKAAEQGLATAQNNLGVFYENGLGTVQNYSKAFELYQKAANLGIAAAQHNLARCFSLGNGVAVNPNEAFKWYRKAAEQGFAQAQYSLGKCYQEGFGTQKNEAEAEKWLSKARNQGFQL